MKLSIITVNLNNKSGLKKTIESIITQNFDDYEFLVIDGGSTDGSVDIIHEYKDKITYWISEPDKGIYNAMNKAIVKAKGEYYHFLNSGDILATKTTLKDAFKEDIHTSFICGNYFYARKNSLEKYEIYKNRDWSFSLYDIFADGLCHQAFFIRYDMFEKYGLYDETLRIASDFKLFFIAIGIHQNPVKYVDVDIVIYDTDGFSSHIGGKAILQEKQKIAQQELSDQVFKRIDHLYFLERNRYITCFIMSKKWIHVLFKAFNKVCIGLRLTEVKYTDQIQ